VRRARPWIISIVVLIAALIAVDRIALVVAEHRAADAIRSAQNLSSTPSVHVDGFPFLTQLAAGTLNTVEVTAADVTVGDGGRSVHVQRLKAVLHRVRLHGLSQATARTVTATVLLDYRELTAALGVPVSYAGPSADGNGRIAARVTVSVLGQQLSGSASAEVAVSSNAVRFVDLRAAAGGAQLPAEVTSALSNVFTVPLSLARLPFHLTLQSVRAGSGGVTLVLTATDVTYG
jgi:hypothetical protein